MTPAEVNMCGAGQPSSDHGSCRTSWRGRMCQGGCNNNRRRPHRFACNRRMSEQECKCQGPGVKARYCPSSSEDQASDQVLISSIFEDHLYIKILSFIGVLTIAYALLRFKAALKSDYKEIPEPIPADFWSTPPPQTALNHASFFLRRDADNPYDWAKPIFYIFHCFFEELSKNNSHLRLLLEQDFF